ncbi:50S ribosomal protein L17 [Pedobacter sp. Hv1]|uniref:50S ribosomal protein L17 n=1 Tax=Pedobacter sp. Hv1 TaxID=1740090 RepID=UPI0009E9A67E
MAGLKKNTGHLGRIKGSGKAMLANMAKALIVNKRLTTTLVKAKALRVYVEPIITKSKNDTVHSRRAVFSYLQDKEVVSILFRDIAEKVANRPSGYTRIIKVKERPVDGTEMALIELVDYNSVYSEDTKPKKKPAHVESTQKISKANSSYKVVGDIESSTGMKKEPLQEGVQDMSLIKDAPHFVEGSNAKIDAFRNYKLLFKYQQTGIIKRTLNEHERQIIEEFDSLNDKEKEEKMVELKNIYSIIS